jgi:hypothetical protein
MRVTPAAAPQNERIQAVERAGARQRQRAALGGVGIGVVEVREVRRIFDIAVHRDGVLRAGRLGGRKARRDEGRQRQDGDGDGSVKSAEHLHD